MPSKSVMTVSERERGGGGRDLMNIKKMIKSVMTVSVLEREMRGHLETETGSQRD